MTESPHLNEAAIALNRFGLGARGDETPPPRYFLRGGFPPPSATSSPA